MTLSDLMSSDVSDVLFNTSEFATSLTQWPGGRSQLAATVTAIVMPMEVIREAEGGEQFVGSYEIQVQTSVTVTERDIWIISGERWSVDRIGNPETGVQPVFLVRHTPRHSNGRGGKF